VINKTRDRTPQATSRSWSAWEILNSQFQHIWRFRSHCYCSR